MILFGYGRDCYVIIGDASARLQVAVVMACLPMASALGGGEEGWRKAATKGNRRCP